MHTCSSGKPYLQENFAGVATGVKSYSGTVGALSEGASPMPSWLMAIMEQDRRKAWEVVEVVHVLSIVPG